MLNPVDPTTTPAWKRLTELHDTMTPDLRAWFADDPERAERFSYELGDLYVDLSKNLLTDDVRDALVELAEQVDVPGRRDAMYAGEHINITEDRAVLHTALRRPAADSLTVDGQDVVVDIEGGQNKHVHVQIGVGDDRPRCRDAVGPRHADVHAHDVGPGRAHHAHRLPAAGGLSHHRDVVVLLQQDAEAGADHRLVVHEYHPDHASSS